MIKYKDKRIKLIKCIKNLEDEKVCIIHIYYFNV